MRLDARVTKDRDWFIWHCEYMKIVPFTVYVDDEQVVYGVYKNLKSLEIQEIKANRIIINTNNKTVLINPIDDDEIDEISTRIDSNLKCPA